MGQVRLGGMVVLVVLGVGLLIPAMFGSDTALLWLAGLFIVLGSIGGLQIYTKQQHERDMLEKEGERQLRIGELKVSDGTKKRMVNREIDIDFTTQMVRYSWGEPTSVDERETLKNGSRKERYVYGVGRSGSPAKYVYFKDQKVTKFKGY